MILSDDISVEVSLENDDTSVTKPVRSTSKPRFKLGVVFLVVASLVGVVCGSYFLLLRFTNNDPTLDLETQHQVEANEPCIFTIKDTHNPVLEITLASSNSEIKLNEDEMKEFEETTIETYNNATGGCSDEFKRWMYDINVVEQKVLKHAVIKDEEQSSIAHKFDNEYNLVIRLETMMSCESCVDDESFASIYPETFGGRSSKRHLTSGFSSSTFYNKLGVAINSIKLDLPPLKKMTLITSSAQHTSHYQAAPTVST